MSQKDHDFLCHSKKKACYVCDCGHGELVRDAFLAHLRKRHNKIVKGDRVELYYFAWGVPRFTRLLSCKYCKFHTPYNQVRELHDCAEHQDNSVTDVTRKHYHSLLPNAAIPYNCMPISIRKDVVAWLQQSKKEIPEGFWSQACDDELRRVQKAVATRTRRRQKATDSNSESEPDVDTEEKELETGERDRVVYHCNPKRIRMQERTRSTTEALHDKKSKRERTEKRKRDDSLRRAKGSRDVSPAHNRPCYGSGQPSTGDFASASAAGVPMDFSLSQDDPSQDLDRRHHEWLQQQQPQPSQSRPQTLASLVGATPTGGSGSPENAKKSRFKIDARYLRRWRFPEMPVHSAPYSAAYYGNVNELNDEGLTCLLTGMYDRPCPIITIKEEPPCGRFFVTDENGEVRAYASITLHRSNPHAVHVSARHRQFNPLGFPYAGDLINRSCKPHQVTHYLALSCPLNQGEYRIVLCVEDDRTNPWSTGMYYVETGRLHGELLDPSLHIGRLLRPERTPPPPPKDQGRPSSGRRTLQGAPY